MQQWKKEGMISNAKAVTFHNNRFVSTHNFSESVEWWHAALFLTKTPTRYIHNEKKSKFLNSIIRNNSQQMSFIVYFTWKFHRNRFDELISNLQKKSDNFIWEHVHIANNRCGL